MEIKTCEQYVLNQLALETERADMLQDERDSILAELNIIKARMKTVEDLLRYMAYDSSGNYIELNYVWKKCNAEEFCLLQSIIGKSANEETN